jgi:hypothetical protein
MARQSKGIKVNVSRLKVIEALEKSLTKLETDYQIGKKLDADYEKQKSDWHNKVLKLTLPLINKTEYCNINIRYNGTINVDFTLPAGSLVLPEEPKFEGKGQMADWQYEQETGEIQSAIRLLRMCEDETVNTATYASISQYL